MIEEIKTLRKDLNAARGRSDGTVDAQYVVDRLDQILDRLNNEDPWISFVEPFAPSGEPVYCCVPQSTAIKHARAAIESRGFDTTDEPEEKLLTEFVVIHWAEKVNGALASSLFKAHKP